MRVETITCVSSVAFANATSHHWKCSPATSTPSFLYTLSPTASAAAMSTVGPRRRNKFTNPLLINTTKSNNNILSNNAKFLFKYCSSSSSSSSSSFPSQEEAEEDNNNNRNGKEDEKDGERRNLRIRELYSRFWKVAAPYWFSSDDKLQARLRLAAVFALTLSTTAISVGFNYLGRDFYNALANKDQDQFTKQLLYYLGGFAGGIPVFVLRDYAKDTLSLRWRSWMTKYYMERYLNNRTFYKIQSQSIIDNPDQRIVDDISSFTSTALAFSLTLFNAAVDLISFSSILYGIYPPFLWFFLLTLLVELLLVFFLDGVWSLSISCKRKKEADFRYGLVRVRENAESIAFYSGEESEMHLLLQRFKNAFENLTQLLISSRNLEFFTNGYRYLIQILPAAVVAPMYFSGKIEFGVINQSVSAFNHILGDFSLIVYQFQAISAFSAVIDRLGEFDDILDSGSSESLSNWSEKINLTYCNSKSALVLDSTNGSILMDNDKKLLDIENLTLLTPSKSSLIKDLSLVINKQDHLLVMGPSGSGKTSLLRALAGLWNFGKGKVTFYVDHGDDPQPSLSAQMNGHEVSGESSKAEELETPTGRKPMGVFFLPQKPYMVLGTLRQQLLYPTWVVDEDSESGGSESASSVQFLMQRAYAENVTGKLSKPTNSDLIQVLEDVRLGYILSRFSSLDSMHEWSSVLSLGEQQRLAFARLLLSKPKLVLLDESTSALDEANEVHLYKQIEEAGITYISIGHRRTLYDYHNKVLHISTADPSSNKRNWHIEYLNNRSLIK